MMFCALKRCLYMFMDNYDLWTLMVDVSLHHDVFRETMVHNLTTSATMLNMVELEDLSLVSQAPPKGLRGLCVAFFPWVMSW